MPSRNEKRFEFRLGKRGLLLFAAGMSILVFTSFWVGLQMGRNMETPVMQVSRVLPPAGIEKGNVPVPTPAKAAETPATGGGNVAAVSPGVIPAPQARSSGAVPPPPAGRPATPSSETASAPRSLPLPDGTVSRKGAVPAAAGAVEHAPAGPKAETAARAAPTVSAPSPAVSRGTTTVNAPSRKQAETVKENGKAKESYSLQVASYKERLKAEEAAKKLASLGFKPRVLAVDLPAKGRWYRIVIGGFESREAAQKAADRISKKIKGASCIIRKA